jgi:hypothetical protein
LRGQQHHFKSSEARTCAHREHTNNRQKLHRLLLYKTFCDLGRPFETKFSA